VHRPVIFLKLQNTKKNPSLIYKNHLHSQPPLTLIDLLFASDAYFISFPKRRVAKFISVYLLRKTIFIFVSGPHPAFYSTGTGGTFRGVKLPRLTTHLSPDPRLRTYKLLPMFPAYTSMTCRGTTLIFLRLTASYIDSTQYCYNLFFSPGNDAEFWDGLRKSSFATDNTKRAFSWS
jgi:hypothetical protein